MSWIGVTWASGNLISRTKMGYMNGNADHLWNEGAGRCWHALMSGGEISGTQIGGPITDILFWVKADGNTVLEIEVTAPRPFSMNFPPLFFGVEPGTWTQLEFGFCNVSGSSFAEAKYCYAHLYVPYEVGVMYFNVNLLYRYSGSTNYYMGTGLSMLSRRT